MNVTFSGGTEREHDAVNFTLRHLLNLNLDLFNINVTFTWTDAIPDPSDSATGHSYVTGLAQKEGDGSFTITLRNDLDEKSGKDLLFYHEVVAHELGHVLVQRLSPDALEKLAALFNTTTDIASLAVYPAPPGVPFEDRIAEGIAETFKDAFLPRKFRENANRTNIKLPITKYPAFRRIFRDGIAGAGEYDVTFFPTFPT